MIRFQDGVPQALWYSQHASGEAFTYNATLKIKGRPVAYSGRGTHANYAIPGSVCTPIQNPFCCVSFVVLTRRLVTTTTPSPDTICQMALLSTTPATARCGIPPATTMRTAMTTRPPSSHHTTRAIPSTGCTLMANGVISRLPTRLEFSASTNTPAVPTVRNSRASFATTCAPTVMTAMSRTISSGKRFPR